MGDYLLGLAVVLATVAAWLLLRAVLGLGAGAIHRLGPRLSESRRRDLGAIIYGAERGWLVGIGNLGIALVAGIENERVREARARLRKEIKLSQSFIDRMGGEREAAPVNEEFFTEGDGDE